MSVRGRRRLFGGILIWWRHGFHWQWPHLVVRIEASRHRMPNDL